MEMGIRTAFVRKTYEMVDDPRTDMIVCWGETGNSFVVKKVAEFSTHLLPSFFKHSNFSSFVRQLNTYGFRKVDPDCWEFANEGFLRGQKHLLKIISRKKPSHVHNNTHHAQPQMQDKPMKSCVEVGNFGIEEEVERLKRDKNVLMQELVRLRQQQQTTDHQLQTVGQRVQVMEQRQQQMMAFLAKAMQSPGFMTQLVQQHSDKNNRRINGVNKKRKLPNQDEEFSDNSTSMQGLCSPNQMVKYQPSMNEAAKTMMGHIMKMNGSSRLEPSMSGSDFLFNNNMQSFAGSSSSQSGLSETLSISSHPYPSFPLCESSPRVNVTTQQDAFVSGISPVHGLLSESSSQLPGFDFHLSETGNTDSVGLVNERTPVIGDGFYCDNRIDNVVLDDIPELPGMSISSHPYLSTEPEIPIPYPSFPLCESSPGVIVTTQQDAFVSGVSPVHGLLSESSFQIPGFDFHLSEAGNTGSVGLVNEKTPVIGDDFSCDNRIDNVVLDDIPELPGINDVFWEQFLSVGQVAGERDEIDSASLESCVSTELDWHKGQESGWENIKDMTHLTERMGLLAQRTRGFNSMFNNCPCSLGLCRCADKR